MINVAALVNSPLTKIKNKNIFYVIGVVNAFVMFTVCPYIKNIVGSKEHSARPMAS